MKTTAQTPSEERLAHDVSKLRKLGADAVIKNGGIVICGDLVCHEEKSIDIDASILDNIVGINGRLFSNAREVQDDFMPRLKNVNGSIHFNKLTKVGNNFMSNIEGVHRCFSFDNLEKVGNNFTSNLVFIGTYHSFPRLKEFGDNFMKNIIGIGKKTHANHIMSPWCPRFLGVKGIKSKYYKKYGFAYFDEILSKVEKVNKVEDLQTLPLLENHYRGVKVKVSEKYTIYSCMFGEYIAKKGKYTARAETIVQAINNLKSKLNNKQ